MVAEKKSWRDIERQIVTLEDDISSSRCLYFLDMTPPSSTHQPVQIKARHKSGKACSVQTVCLLVGKSVLSPLQNAFEKSETRQEEHQTLLTRKPAAVTTDEGFAVQYYSVSGWMWYKHTLISVPF